MTLVKLESTISVYLNPDYLSITDEQDETLYILCILSHSRYNNIPIADRIQSVYDVLETYIPEVLAENTVVVQVFGNNEFENIIEDLFPQ